MSAPASPDQSDSSTTFDTNTQFSPSMAIILVVLLSAFFFMGFFSIYVKRCTGDDDATGFRGRETGGGGGDGATSHPSIAQGLDAAVVRALPLITYTTTKKRGSNVDCVVCLMDFIDGETVRQLPKCKHVFHPDCIDMWLYSHTTCPLCRRGVSGESSRPSFRWGGGSGSIRLWGSGRQSAGPATPTEGSVRPAAENGPTTPNPTDFSHHPRQLSLSRSHSTGHSILKRVFSRGRASTPLSALADVHVAPADLQRSRTVAASSTVFSNPSPTLLRFLRRGFSTRTGGGPADVPAEGPSSDAFSSHVPNSGAGAEASATAFERLSAVL